MYSPKQEPSHEQTLHWLRWLSQKLTAESKSEFALEEMQPSWLETSREKLIYRISVGLTYGLIFGLFVALLVGLSFGLLVALFFALVGEINSGFIGLFFVIVWIVNFWPIGLMLWLIGRLDVGLIDEIKPVALLDLSKKAATSRMKYGGLGGVSCIVATSPSFGLSGFLLGLSVLLNTLLTVALLYSQRDSEPQAKTVPNQPLRESAKNAGILALISLPACMLACVLPQLAVQQAVEPLWTLIIGLGGGLFFGLASGGLPCVQHLILRLILWRRGDIPWNYTQFLNYAAEQGFVQQVDGYYRFVQEVPQESAVETNETDLSSEGNETDLSSIPGELANSDSSLPGLN